MATLDQDMIRFRFDTGDFKDAWLKNTNLSWPPPERLDAFFLKWKRVKMSVLSDEQAREMKFIARGAEYHLDENQDEDAPYAVVQ